MCNPRSIKWNTLIANEACLRKDVATGPILEALMRILLINPNTSPDITNLVTLAAIKVASPDTEIIAASGRFGARYIASRAAAAIAAHAALDAYAEHGADADVIGLACFGDPGLAGLKELATQPVIGMAEAACLDAASGGRRFAIVTGGERWGPMLEEFVAFLGLSRQLAGVATVAPSGGDIARDPDGALALLASAANACVKDHGADVVILGGAGLAGLAERLQDRVPCPLIDSVTSLVRAAERLGRECPGKPTSGSYAQTPPTQSIGLSPLLTSKLAGQAT
jgi:allantoin racemase